MTLTRRVFLRLSAVVSAWLGLPRRSLAVTGQPSSRVPGLGPQELMPLAEAVLPVELGLAGMTREVNEFATFIASYRPGAETIHPYGSERLGTVPAFNAATWASQLRALDTAAHERHGKDFAGASVPQRAALIQEALAAANLPNRVPQKIAAPHVALGLLTHFLDSPAATNLAYERVIDPRQCRPLAESSRVPVSLGRAPSRGGAAR